MSPSPDHAGHAGDDPRVIPTTALLLGAGGVLPFISLGFIALMGLEWRLGFEPGLARQGLVAYGVAILSFLGGVRWGVGLGVADGRTHSRLLVASVLPALAGWIAFMLPRPHDLSVLIAGFLVLAVADIALVRQGHAPTWYATLRLGLTGAVVLVLIVALAFLPLAPE